MNEPIVKAHAVLAPSGADAWMTCKGSTILTEGMPDNDNVYSVEGTDYHELAAICLEQGTDAVDFVGHALPSGALITEENAKYLQEGYIDPVRSYSALGSLAVEQKVPLTWYTGIATDTGTSDAVITGLDRELIIADLKFGRGVEVNPEKNRQCMIYALSFIVKEQLEDEYDSVRLVICQPRTGDGKPKEWVISMPDLLLFRDEVIRVAKEIDKAKAGYRINKVNTLPLVPSEKACRFCKAKGTCPALMNVVDNALADGFESLAQKGEDVLGAAMDKVDLVEIWMKGVRSQTEIELLAGRKVTGYRLVQGKKGNRKWSDEEQVTELLRKKFRMKIEDVYDLSLISPTTAEKRLAKEHPTRWEQLGGFVTQSPGSASVAKIGDKRPDYVAPPVSLEGFEAVEEDCSDLL